MKTATSKLTLFCTKSALFTFATLASVPAQAGMRFLREGDLGPELGGSLLEQAVKWVTMTLSGFLGVVVP